MIHSLTLFQTGQKAVATFCQGFLTGLHFAQLTFLMEILLRFQIIQKLCIIFVGYKFLSFECFMNQWHQQKKINLN